MSAPDFLRLSRRAFLGRGALWLGAGGAASLDALQEDSARAALTVGLITDLHYGDKPPAGTRHYRESIAKIREAVDAFRQAPVDFSVELGDLIDAAETVEAEIAWLRTIDAEFRRSPGDRHYVLGNHCVSTLNKSQFLSTCGLQSSYYSFDRNGFHFVILDACFRRDGVPYGENNFDWKDSEIPREQRDWLAADLSAAQSNALLFTHQRLDTGPPYGIHSAPVVREIIERSGKVLAVIQGHDHKGHYQEINGTHYCTLSAMVEGSGLVNSAYCILRLGRQGSIQLEGFRRQAVYTWSR